MSDGKTISAKKPKISRVEVYWHTVQYRTVALYVLVIAAIICASAFLVFPETSNKLLEHLSAAFPAHDPGVATITSRQARFVNLDGKVQVKKANSVQWVNADYQLTLDKDDLIQTGPEGVARIAFSDGTTYTVKGDTLVTVEQNHVERDRATTVGVHISSGQVDLATGTWEVPGDVGDLMVLHYAGPPTHEAGYDFSWSGDTMSLSAENADYDFNADGIREAARMRTSFARAH